MKGLFEHFATKALAVLIAASLWLYVSANQARQDSVPGDVPLTVSSVPAGLVPVYDTASVRIIVSAPGAVWQALKSDSFQAKLELAALKEGTVSVPVTVTSLVPGVEIAQVIPDHVIVRLEPEKAKQVKAAIKTSGQAAAGSVLGTTALTPDHVTVRGPQSELNALAQVSAEVKLNGETDGFERDVGWLAEDASGKALTHVRFEPQTAHVVIQLSKAGPVKNVGVHVVTSGHTSDGSILSAIVVNPATISISSEASLISGLQTIDTAPLPLDGVGAGDLSKVVSLVLPKGVNLVGGAATVQVKATLSQPQTERELTVGFDVKLPPNAKLVSTTPSSVKVVLSGPASFINSLSPNSVVVSIDASQKPLGTLVLDLAKTQVVVPTGVSVISLLPSSVQLLTAAR